MKGIQIEFVGEDEYAPTFYNVTHLVYGETWLTFKFKEDGDPHPWKQSHPISRIHAVREWHE
jgi:hypothetical protein